MADASSRLISPNSHAFLIILTVPSHGIIEDVGVGYILLPTTVSRFGNLFSDQAFSGVIVAAIAEQLLGVGHFA
jgi:hypothetical protein